ncbi:hypothetical protein HK405_009425, partial [Cladochytrium tenue]
MQPRHGLLSSTRKPGSAFGRYSGGSGGGGGRSSMSGRASGVSDSSAPGGGGSGGNINGNGNAVESVAPRSRTGLRATFDKYDADGSGSIS